MISSAARASICYPRTPSPRLTRHILSANMDKFKSVAKGGWHPEKERTNSGSSAGGQSDSKIGQVVCKGTFL